MTIPEHSIRRVVKYKLRDLLRAQLEDVKVEVGWPDARVRSTSVWIGETTGVKSGIALGAPRRIYNDRFTCSVLIQTTGRTDESAEAAMELITEQLEDLLSTNPSLDIDGLLDSGMDIEIDETPPFAHDDAIWMVVEYRIPFFARIQ